MQLDKRFAHDLSVFEYLTDELINWLLCVRNEYTVDFYFSMLIFSY